MYRNICGDFPINHLNPILIRQAKEIILAPDRIIMQATDVSITWHDEDGVIITTKNNVKIRADELIDISAAEIRVDAGEKLKSLAAAAISI